MATKKTATKKVAKTTPKKTVKAPAKKVEKKAPVKPVTKMSKIYNKEVSFLLVIAVEVLLLMFGYLIIMLNI